MKIVHDFGGECYDGVNTYLKLEEYQDNSKKEVLMYGINCTINKPFQQFHKNFKRKTLLNLWDPCALYTRDDVLGQDYHKQIEYFDDVYSICPYTAEWTNELYGKKKLYYSFYPFNEKHIPELQNKIYDVCYFGGIHDKEHEECINAISKFKYRFISQMSHPKVTNWSVPNLEKLDIVAKTKITVCYNLLYLKSHQIEKVKTYSGWEKNKAFSKINETNIVPQFKSRVHEAAVSKTLILCKKDPWNLIEDFYTPGEDFIYFNSNDELEGKIKEILDNWNEYKHIPENAYKKAFNYTTDKLVKMIEDKNEISCVGL